MESEYMDERPSSQLVKGAAALVVGVGLFIAFFVIVAMTPDPNHEINYKLFLGVEGVLVLVIIYGGWKLDKLDKFLRLCERTTEVWHSKKSSTEN